MSSVIVPELHEVLTIEEYMARKLGDHGFNDADRELAAFIHNAVYKEGELGLSLKTLKVSYTLFTIPFACVSLLREKVHQAISCCLTVIRRRQS